jgi:hypothetical protein
MERGSAANVRSPPQADIPLSTQSGRPLFVRPQDHSITARISPLGEAALDGVSETA